MLGGIACNGDPWHLSGWRWFHTLEGKDTRNQSNSSEVKGGALKNLLCRYLSHSQSIY